MVVVAAQDMPSVVRQGAAPARLLRAETILRITRGPRAWRSKGVRASEEQSGQDGAQWCRSGLARAAADGQGGGGGGVGQDLLGVEGHQLAAE